jgi:hypothetical protein
MEDFEWCVSRSQASCASAALASAQPQAPADSKSPFTFDVASVKPTPPSERGGIIHQPPGGKSYEAVGVPLGLESGKGPVEFQPPLSIARRGLF